MPCAGWLPDQLPRLLTVLAACCRLRSLYTVDCGLTADALRDVRHLAHMEVLD